LAASPFRFGPELAWSFALAQLVSLTTLPLAVGLAWLARSYPWLRNLCWSACLVGLAVPGPVVALALGRAVNQPGSDWLFYLYDRTLFVPWLALVVRLFPFAYLLAEIVSRQFDPQYQALAWVSGASQWQTFRHVLLPQLAPSLIWIWLVLQALALGDLSSTILAVPPGVTTVAIGIFNLVHYGVRDELAGLCLTTVALFAGLASLVLLFAPSRSGPPRPEP
jgi:ABC-type Fe3+ transport system permease subunit